MGALRSRLRYRPQLHHHQGRDRDELWQLAEGYRRVAITVHIPMTWKRPRWP
jgi:hypothetical protein